MVVQKELVKAKTRKQAVSLRWHEENFGHLTVLILAEYCYASLASAFEKLGCNLLHSKGLSNVAAIRWGREHEQVAFDQYSVTQPWRHRNMRLNFI